MRRSRKRDEGAIRIDGVTVWSAFAVAKRLGLQEDSVRKYAIRRGIGQKFATRWCFTDEEVKLLENRMTRADYYARGSRA
ncbi:hypothetical protein CMI37_22735 [Candidatus Pacearchaeota archaeon]|nr:hypothetical protein [Candidatus Pacearchaeota archaeon]